MAVPDPNARSVQGGRDLANEVLDRAHNLIEKCIQLCMDRDETAKTIEMYAAIDRRIAHLGERSSSWPNQWLMLKLVRLAEFNREFFRNYYVRLALRRQIVRFNELLEQQHQAMNFPPVPAEQQISIELADTAPQADSPVSITNYDNEAESDMLPATPVGSVGSEEVAGSAPHLVPSGSLARLSSEAQGMKINAALDAAHMPILQVPNLTAGGHQAANFGGPFKTSNLMAQSLKHPDLIPEASAQENLSNSASAQDSPSAEL